MSISFSCDFCSRKYRVEEKLAGRKVKCKECGTDLTIPSPGAVVLTESDYAPSTPSLARDKYGFDDDLEVIAPATRQNRSASLPRSSTPRRRSEENSANQIWRVLGVVVLLVVAVPVVIFVLGVIQNPGLLKPVPARAPAPFVNVNRNAPPPNFPVDPAPLATKTPGIFISLSDGKATPASTPFGRPTVGVEFSADYRMTGNRPHDVVRFFAVVKGPKSRASGSMMGMHDQSGTVGGSVMMMSQNDGPFEMYIEGEVPGPRGMTRHKVSDTIPLPWRDLPQQQPQQPGFPAAGQPGNFPGQPGYRPPGMPTIPPPRFGPRGRP